MLLPVYKKGTKLYGNDGIYTLIKKEGNEVTYIFQPWEDASINACVIENKDIEKLSDILHIRILWAVWEDD